METIYRAYKYRLYPNKEQEVLIGMGHPESKPLENTLIKQGSKKEETQGSFVLGKAQALG